MYVTEPELAKVRPTPPASAAREARLLDAIGSTANLSHPSFHYNRSSLSFMLGLCSIPVRPRDRP